MHQEKLEHAIIKKNNIYMCTYEQMGETQESLFLITDFCVADFAAFLKWKKKGGRLNGKLSSIR